jgi:serine/threonine-protein kinase
LKIPEPGVCLDLEEKILARLCHPNIVQCYGGYDDVNGRTLILESLSNKDLIDSLSLWKRHDEERTLSAVRDIGSALNYLHNDPEIAHRDVKLDNIIEEDGRFVLIDFGHADFASVCENSEDNEVCEEEDEDLAYGSNGYRPPEYLGGRQYGRAGDIWALGVTAVILYSGGCPTPLENGEISEGELDTLLEGMSVDGRRVLKRMLHADAAYRLTSAELVKDVWLRPVQEESLASESGFI